MDVRFYVCKHCGNIIAYAKSSGVPVVCCGEPMQELVPGSVDAAKEKHVPVIEVSDQAVTVRVGSVAHPMTEAHSIEWICLQTKQGNQRKALRPSDAPEARFAICKDDTVLAAFAYCNLHGLWKAEA